MKKLFLCCLLACGCLAKLSAQDTKKWYNGIGIRAGATISSLRITPIFNESTWGYSVGACYKVRLNQHLGLIPGISFVTKGGKDFQPKFNITARMKLSYILIPVMLSYDFHLGDFHIAPSAGAYYGYCLSGIVSASDGSSSSWVNPDNPSQKLLRRSDAGIRFNCEFGWKHFVIGLGYDLGLLNIAEPYDPFTRIPTHRVCRTQSVFLTTGWNF